MANLSFTAVCGILCVWMLQCSGKEYPPKCYYTPSEGNTTENKVMSCSGIYPIQIPSYVNQVIIIQVSKPTINNNDTQTLGRLDVLHLLNMDIEIIDSGTFSVENLKNLKSLWLSNNRIKEIKSDTFSDLVELNELHLNLNLIETVADNAFSKLLQLTVLQMKINRLKEAPNNLPKSLKELHLQSNDISHLKLTHTYPQLIHLDLGGNSFKDVSYEDLLIPNTLEYLCLGDEVKDIDQKIYSALGKLKTLIVKSDDELSLRAVIGINDLKELASLTISSPRVPSHSLVFKNLKKLNELALLNVKTSVDIADDFFSAFDSLVKLDLSYSTELTSKIFGNKNIFKHLRHIETLKLEGTGLSKLHPEMFDTLLKLKVLDISNNPLTCNCQLLNVFLQIRDKNLFLSKPDEVQCVDVKKKQRFEIHDKRLNQLYCNGTIEKTFRYIDDDQFTIDIFEMETTVSTPLVSNYGIHSSLLYVIIALTLVVVMFSIAMFCILMKYRKARRCSIRRSRVTSVF